LHERATTNGRLRGALARTALDERVAPRRPALDADERAKSS
jgi:hypothetical protein